MAIELKGAKAFRYRIVLSTLLGQTIRITSIREQDSNPGIRDYEVDFLKLVSEVTSGAQIDIGKDGTSILYKPGIVNGGNFQHTCNNGRSLGYYVVPLLLILPFGKGSTTITLNGITNGNDDLSIDLIRSTTIPLIQKFGIEEDMLNVKVIKRGAPPVGDGEVVINSSIIKQLNPINLTEQGLVRSIRGVAYSTKTSPQMSNRMGEASKGILSQYLQDVYITTDHWKGKEAGTSPGYGVILTASTTNGNIISTELFGEAGNVPEDIGQKVACGLLREIETGGCIDSMHQPWLFILMTLCSEDVSKLRCGDLTAQAVECLRTIKALTGVTFQAQWDEKTKTSLLSCIGIGFCNLSRKIH
ncbi:18S rRNA biogenesis protein RCL1, putative [Entamoeba histolytica HM-1:IMSS-B]|uniref:RNA 3'-terminal phosphate cyclase, putative n=6 Tax=Entamoeba histolytica TaxID=5759 RepID=C4M8E8_ENTH1|nr:RNA 3'-terminal phosphate cyclase, putative [Entamoeba histolytica HM-1:IMSS]EMD47176.1 RNA 3'terminal phosphate cyclase, putative [Entamoeba histolytica KU27]EMH72144.1 18S rRNA biogenesis protein RCL1, putative [Entamoeba histolytica HM-1:IMSS-B]EMS10907.1 RNA 3'-terminal phosphate cyclase, putative [Entamoeba histolytica HM-3:IMSS]ENY65428.1 RNA 3'-terminal phosphate cyclase, putative [Entamoeba histolytica HM-1:IMSS-A]GAT97871.1 RNA 3-terminal phosphate cyclase putative [Entamoeba histo|eukprot:XP_649981.1 RNA 3'-terminal phosphate cyclase, putative [Entamoeba histolytica HM-1:IMSS]